MKYKHAENIVYAPREDGSVVLTDIDDFIKELVERSFILQV